MSQPQLAENLLPLRKPWILVDDVLTAEPDRVVCRKQITSSDFFLIGHFPDESVYPGVLLLEGARQASELLLVGARRALQPKHVEARFLVPVVPGQTVIFTAVPTGEQHPGRLRISVKGVVDNRAVVQAWITYDEEDLSATGPSSPHQRRKTDGSDATTLTASGTVSGGSSLY